MPQIITCRNAGCRQRLRIPDAFAHYDITCPTCRTQFRHAETPEARAQREGGGAAFTHEHIAAALRARESDLFTTLRADVHAMLLALTPAQALSFRLLDGDSERSTLAPEATPAYAKVLLAFARGRPHEGCTVDSAVTPRVVARVEQTLLAFFASAPVQRAVTDAVVQTFAAAGGAGGSVARELERDEAWLRQELQTLLHYGSADSLALQLLNLGADEMHRFMATGVGHQLGLAIGKVMATAAGKAFVLEALKAAIAKVMASAALKAALVSVLRKIGIGILIKSAVGKALLALLAALGLAHVPVFWVLVPALAAFMAWEYHHFPERLAARVPDEVERIVREHYLEISDAAAREIFKATLAELVRRMTEVRT